jgi:RimJ/RimL family protein N-acetyltransferase
MTLPGEATLPSPPLSTTWPLIETDRLILRRWEEKDLGPFAALNADPEVMRHFPATLTTEESDALVGRIEAHFERHGYGPWAMETKEDHVFLGFTGLTLHEFPAHFNPAVEVGWRMARENWGQGYATEAARASLALGFGEMGLDEIVSMTVPANMRSLAVMERLGMTRDPADDFDHPRIPEGSPLRRHVLYRIRPSQFTG